MEGTSSLAATCPRDGPAGRRRAARRWVGSPEFGSAAGDGGTCACLDLRALPSLFGSGGGSEGTAFCAGGGASEGPPSEEAEESASIGGGSGKSGGKREADLSCAMVWFGPQAPARRIPFARIAHFAVPAQI